MVEVDGDTGEVELQKYVAVDDVGNVINPMIVEGMVHAEWCRAWVRHSPKKRCTTSPPAHYRQYDGLRHTHCRERTVYHHRSHDHPVADQPSGVKGAGETGTIAASPAVMNAVIDALSPFSITHMNMPAKPEKVWRAMQG